MHILPHSRRAVHVVRVYLPDGDFHEVETTGTGGDTGLRLAMRVAGALAGWLAVDEWESASRFVPAGPKRVRKMLLEDGEVDLTRCRVAVLCESEGPDAENGYEEVVSYRVGERVPPAVQQIRAETKEEGWRGDGEDVPPLRVARAN